MAVIGELMRQDGEMMRLEDSKATSSSLQRDPHFFAFSIPTTEGCVLEDQFRLHSMLMMSTYLAMFFLVDMLSDAQLEY